MARTLPLAGVLPGVRPGVLLVALLTAPSLARAGDTWTNIAPGVDHLHRTAAGPQDYHVVKIDLTRPEIYLRATGPGENGQKTSAWAASVRATVAVNGDLWDADNWEAYDPLGLAVGDGWKWSDDTPDWAFFACDPTKSCYFSGWGALEASNPRWWNAVGGMQDLLVIDGAPQAYGGTYYATRNPRTALGLSQDGGTLILLVVDGRRSGAIGMNFAELTAVMVEFGAWNAMNIDGGGSSTLVVRGAIQNSPSDGYERTVANHLGILIADHTDAACAGTENARLCVDGHNMRTCTGGLDRGLGDCGYFGLACEQTGLFAYCVDPRCTNGGQENLCLDATRIGMCRDGVYGEGDCAGFGLPCVAGFGTAWCWADFHQAEPVASSLGAPAGGELTLEAGATAEVWFELRNTGRVPFRPGPTLIAPLPRDAASPLAGPGWPSPTRAATVPAEVAPGAVGRFTFTVRAPATTGDHVLSLGLLEEGVTWFADRPGGGGPADGALAVTLHVLPAGAAPDGEAPPTPGADGGGAGGGDGGDPGAGPGGGLAGGCGCGAGGGGGVGAVGSSIGAALLALLPWRRRRRGRAGRDPSPRLGVP